MFFPSLVMLLLCYGLCFGVQHKISFIQYQWYWLDRFLECPYCVGFHCGWVVWILVERTGGLVEALVWSFVSAAFCYILDTVVRLAESHISR